MSSTPRRTSDVRRRTSHAFALVSALAVLACARDAGEESVQAVVSVRTDVAVSQPFTDLVGAIGMVTGRPGHIAAITAPAPARVARVLVAVGQHVAEGTELVQLDQTPFAGTSRAAAAALDAAQRAYDRTERLVTAGISPRKDLDQAAADLEHARAEASQAQRQQELSVMRAPIGGVVTRVSATVGATADPSQVLVEIADPAAFDLLFTVTPTQAGRIQRGAKISVSAGQSAAGEPLGVATVIDVGGIVDTASRGVSVRAQSPTTRRPLRIGETVFGEIVAVVHPNAIVVPVEAVVPDGAGFKVFVVDAGGTARARPVTVGGRTDRAAEITSGLRAGERIVTYGAYGIEDSAKVVPLGTRPTP